MKNNFSIFKKYTKDFISFSGFQIIKLLLYSILAGVTQGIGIFMLIPFLNTVGAGEIINHNSGLNKISCFFLDIYKYLEIPLNLFTILLLFIIIIALSKLIQYKQGILNAEVKNKYISNIQARLFKSVIFAEWQFIANQRSSNLTHVITNDLPAISNGTYFFLKIFTSLILSIIYISWAMLISIELTLFTIFFAGLSFLFTKICLPHSVKTGSFARLARSEIYSILLDHVQGLKIAKSYGAEKREYNKFKEIAGDIAKTQTSMIKLNSKIRISYALIINILLCVFIYISIRLLNVPFASLFLLIVIFSKLLPNISSFQNDFQHLFSMLPSFKASEDLLQQAEIHQENLVLNPKAAPLKLTQNIKFNNLSFSYPGKDSKFFINKVNLEIPAFKTIAIVGESGTGKSTIVDLITGILKPDNGSITVDGIKLAKENLLQWRKITGYLPQEVFLFHDTIKNNILWGKPDATDDEIIVSLKSASAYDFVQKLPEGLDTVVKDRGLRLSGGERQRIALTRTLIRKPQLLILDEATSSLDKDNESKIYDSISKLHGKMTIILITHRSETLKFADKVINISKYISQECK